MLPISALAAVLATYLLCRRPYYARRVPFSLITSAFAVQRVVQAYRAKLLDPSRPGVVTLFRIPPNIRAFVIAAHTGPTKVSGDAPLHGYRSLHTHPCSFVRTLTRICALRRSSKDAP
ncbi:hypothetical protein PLICRDRAFT_270630 [Plicaturopsis crispa FD-325 SS-3]|nr:hypothetical protein PLICRDRAFT_270630 [Plicaturopsis crispa FD-325 SS-3]